jgi:hypothetical protein
MTIVNLPPTKDILLVHAGDDPGIIINRDLVNPVYFGPHSAFVTPGEASIIDALTFVQYSGDVDVYAHSGGAGFIQVDVQPNCENWSPSPAQSAASIAASGLMLDTTGQNIFSNQATAAQQVTQLNAINAPAYSPITTANAGLLSTLAGQNNQNTAIPNNIAATGVPALNLKSTVTAANAITIATGVTQALTAVTGINQPAYNLHLTATAGASSAKPWYTVTVKWVDTASGFVVQVDAYTAFMSSVSNTMSTVIAGPTDADQCQISVTNNDSVTMTLNTAFFVLSSRTNYTTDLMYQFWSSASMPSIPTFQLGPSVSVPTGKILFGLTRSVGIGVTTTPDYALPGYAGQAYVHFDGGGSNNWDIVMTEQLTTTTVHRQIYTGAPALGNIPMIIPRAPCTIKFTNNGSVSGTMNCEITVV